MSDGYVLYVKKANFLNERYKFKTATSRIQM